MTAAKEAGVSIEIDGKKVALGVPGAKPAASSIPADAKSYPHIPLARPGTADEAAAAMLLYVITSLACMSILTRIELSLASPLASYVSGHTLEVTGGMGI